LSLLKSNGIDPQVVLYLDTPPDAETLRSLLHMLGMAFYTWSTLDQLAS
jgi:arsenate reductase